MSQDAAGPPHSGPERYIQETPPTVAGPDRTTNDLSSKPGRPQKQEKWPQRVEAACAIALVIITGFYACYAKFQRDAMLESNRLNRDALESVQRAFVTFHEMPVTKILVRTKDGDIPYWEFHTTWENSGTTPAIGVVQHFNIGELAEEPTNQQFRGGPAEFTITTIGPKGRQDSSRITKPESFVFGNLMQVPPSRRYTSTITRRRFFWGWIAYRDVFPRTKPHVSEFCHELSGSYIAPQKTADVVSFTYSGCRHHNCVDNYCEDYESIAAMTPN